ncbi:MAG: hypothetical protein WCF65_09350 [Parachlamydiaceae bacterium]
MTPNTTQDDNYQTIAGSNRHYGFTTSSVDTTGQSTTSPDQNASATYNKYYTTSTMMPATENELQSFNFPARKPVNPHHLQDRFVEITADFEKALKEAHIDFEKVQQAIYSIIRYQKQDIAHTHKEFIRDMRGKITLTAQLVKDTHNNLWGMAITLGAAAVGVGGAFAGLAFMLPSTMISVEVAKSLSSASYAFSGASSSLGSLASIPNGKQDGVRGVLQVDLERFKSREDEEKQAKHSDKESLNRARDAAEAFERMCHEARGSVLA